MLVMSRAEDELYVSNACSLRLTWIKAINKLVFVCLRK